MVEWWSLLPLPIWKRRGWSCALVFSVEIVEPEALQDLVRHQIRTLAAHFGVTTADDETKER